ncbi:MAG TPA: hypothetical protein VJZ03_05820, partial [Candidatus Bathyarchaeia archaeon]|nr:hypothetical protein [Candidatus Bathyarchaeia archaeon]
MKLLRLVPLVTLLVIIVSLMPLTYATTVTGYSNFNTYQVISPINLAARQAIDVTLTISWMAGGKPANPTPTFEAFTYSAPSANNQTFPQGAPRLVSTVVSPDSATVHFTGRLTDNGKTTPIRCNQRVQLLLNVPVQVVCTISSVMLPGGQYNVLALTVQITNTGQWGTPS